MNTVADEPRVPASHRDALYDLAQRVQQLSLDRRDPERFHMDKSEIAQDLRRLARKSEACR